MKHPPAAARTVTVTVVVAVVVTLLRDFCVPFTGQV